MKNLFFLAILIIPTFTWSQSAMTKGDAQYEMGAYNEAIKSYQIALSENGEDPSLISKIADCYAEKNDFLKSADWYAKIVDTDNVSPDELFAYAQILKSLKMYGKAKHYFERYSMFDIDGGQQFMESCDYAIQAIKSPDAMKVTNPYFNTRETDFAPAYYDQKLVYTSFRKDILKTRKVAFSSNESNAHASDVYWIDPTNDSKAQLLLDNLDDHSWLGPIAFSGDQTSVAITKNNFKEGNRFFLSERASLSIYFAEVNQDGSWADSKPFVFNDNSYSVGFPWLSDNGQTLIFSSNMPGGEGGFDLYVSHRDGQAWTTPENLGPEINTSGNEISPFKTEHNFYFSSDYHPGLGGYDVFAMDNNDTELQVVNMGYGVNSPKDDFGFIYNVTNETGYISSDRTNSRGGLDIYKLQGQIREVTIIVKDKTTKEPVENAQIKFVNINTNLLTNKNGVAKIVLSKNREEEVIISTVGYRKMNMKLANLKQSKLSMKYDVFIERSDDQMAASNSGQVNVVEMPSAPIMEADPRVEMVEKRKFVEMEKNIPVTKKKVYVKVVQKEKYAIQVSAFSKGDFDRNTYGNLESIGQVYDRQEANMTKIRVGYFSDKSAASEMLRQVRQLGYKDAFVVKEMASDLDEGSTSGITGNATGSQYFEDNSDYKVRLATYSKSGKFDAGKVEHLGKLESYRKNEMTIMLLAGYPTLPDAKLALKAARMNGFVDAYIVKDMGGYLEKITLD